MKKKTLMASIFIIIVIILWVHTSQKNIKIVAPEKNYSVLLANTEELRVHGLSDKKELEKNNVMLFTFDRPQNIGIWMKDMLFNIDIVFADENWNVINYFDDVSPSTYPTVFYPTSPAMYVIEMNSGERLRAGIDKGVKLYYK